MKTKKFILLILVLVTASALLKSCATKESASLNPCTGKRATVSFVFEPPATKSSTDFQPNYIHDVTILAFNKSGKLESSAYKSKIDNNIKLELKVGERYNIYALANCGDVSSKFGRESDAVNYRFVVSDFTGLRSVPMAATKTVNIQNNIKEIQIPLERLISKINFSVSSEALSHGIKINSVQLKQTPLDVSPFGDNSSATAVGDGDRASAQDLEALNAGTGKVSFFVLENCQGVLLPGNTNEWNKIPDNIPSKKDLCTYIEVSARLLGQNDGSIGTATYRFFLGKDSTTDFNIQRNTEYTVSLSLTNDGLNHFSWKIEKDLIGLSSSAQGKIKIGYHELSDLYVGEKFLYGITFDPRLIAHLNNEIHNCSIKTFLSSGEHIDAIRFGELKEDGPNKYTSEALCFQPYENAEIWLCRSKEKIVKLNSSIQVKKPIIVQSFESSALEAVTPIDDLPTCSINGHNSEIFYYLCDKNNENLESGKLYGFEKSLFSLNFENAAPDPIRRSVLIEASAPPTINGAHAVSGKIIIRNDGQNELQNLAIADHLGTMLKIKLKERNYNIADSCYVEILSEDINMSFDIYNNRILFYINNPSNLSLSSHIYLIESKYNYNDYRHRTTQTFSDYLYERIPCIMGTNNNYYCIETKLKCSLSPSGSPYTKSGNKLCYSLFNNYSTLISKVSDNFPDEYGPDKESEYGLMIEMVIQGNKRKHRLQNSKPIPINIISSELIYFGTKFGYALYSMESLLKKDLPESLNPINPEKISNLRVQPNYSISLNVGNNKLRISNAPININSKIKCSGQGGVTVYPNGKARPPQYHTLGPPQTSATYYTTTNSPSNTDICDFNSYINNNIYSHTEFDSYNWLGSANSYQHHYHPININVESYYKSEVSDFVIPVAFNKSNFANIDYYHAQENKTYNVDMNYKIIPGYITIIEPK